MIPTQEQTFIPRRWQTEALSVFQNWYENRQPGDSRTFISWLPIS